MMALQVLENRSVTDYIGDEKVDSGTFHSIESTYTSTLLRDSPVDFIADFSGPNDLEYYGEAVRGMVEL